MDHERIHFGSRFKQEREARHLSLGDVARVTKIPERSLERLEGGRFDELPAEVFVRGFVRSYARAVGLDPDDMARRYGQLVQSTLPSAAGSAEIVKAAKSEASLVGAVRHAAQRVARPETATSHRLPTQVAIAVSDVVAPPAAEPELAHGSIDASDAPLAATAAPFEDEGAVVVRKPARAAKKDPSHTDEMRTLSKAILDAGRETRRLPLTLAVIILVIVATLTMSLLLNRPNHIGDGITRRGVATDARA